MICKNCAYLEKCTHSKNHVKVVTRHIWEDYIEQCEDIRHTKGSKELYEKRKETIERIFGTAKEHHGLRYTQNIGKEKNVHESRADFCMPKFKEISKDEENKRAIRPFRSIIYH